MAEQITIEQALELVEFEHGPEGWRVKNVKGDVCGDVVGNVCGDIFGDVHGNVWGVINVINGRKWQFIETPKEKLKRLIEEGADKARLLEALNQLEESSHD